ncbi:uncharacterized protein LOC143422693 isoform X2 [Xylocopa sonorina]|uniref:uncharacterized protein LOC143422693 isoform X2 n=1 Tax=Xylocopa sonorina TaxID=1818115 RepID=UPI00403AFB7B
MAAALLGKCVGLLALVVLLCYCGRCYAFRIRDHPVSGQTAAATSPEQPHRGSSCTSMFGRCQEKATTTSTASRKWRDATVPRLASTARKPPVELTSVDGYDAGTEGQRVRQVRRPVDRHGLDDEPYGPSKSVEVDEDDDDDEVIVEVEDDGEEIVSGEEDEDENGDSDDGGTGDEVEEDRQDRASESAKAIRDGRKVMGDTVKDETKVESKRKASIEKGFREMIKSRKQDKVDENEDEDESEEVEDAAPTPPPRVLEKSRHADKEKARSTATVAVTEKPKIEPKEVSKAKGVPETGKKPEGKKSAETVAKPAEATTKPAEATKKVEPGKITKSESESSRAKAVVKSEEKGKMSKPQETAKQPVKKTAPVKVKEVERSDKGESKVKTKTHVEAPFTLSELNDAILRVPTFVPNFTAVENLECQQHGRIFLRQLRGYKLWALQMLDASAKLSSGLLRGNVNQFGDFDECLGIVAHVKLNEKTVKVQGKYCLANIDLYPSRADMKLPVNMMQARGFIRGTMHDPGHFIPKFTTVNWALCLPAACTAEDARNVLEYALREYNSTVGIKFVVDVDPDMCYVQQKSRSYSKETIGVLYFYAIFACLVAVATVRDYLVVTERKGNYSERIIMAFSLRRTVRSLLKRGTSDFDIACIHGIRAIATIVLYVAHQIPIIARLPFSNRIAFTEVANIPISTVLRASMVYTDTFLLISGVLTAYNMAHEFITRGEIRWFCRFIARYIRLTPALLAVVFWYAFIMEHVGTGPQWNSVVTPNAELCKSNAWTNLLYIQNFFPFEEMCATHTHQLALDMQLSLLAPMLVFFLECRPIIGILVIFFFILLSATLRYVATMSNYLSIVIFHGMSLKHLYRTGNLIYILPLHRATPYVFGVGLGVLLRYTGKDVRIHKVLVILGWLIAMALGSWSLFSPWHLARRDYVYDAEEATNYAVISPVLWALALCWFILACYTHHGGMINRFLSSHWLMVFSRVSYAVYLTQFAVFFHNVGTARYSSEFQVHRAIDPFEAAAVMAVSIVLTLFFDLPMQEIKSVLMESTDVLNVEVPAKEGSTSAQPLAAPQKPSQPEQIQEKKVFEEDEVALTGWDWQRDIVDGGTRFGHETVEDEEQVHVPILKKPDGRRRSFIGHELSETRTLSSWDRSEGLNKRSSTDDDEYRDHRYRSRSGQRDYQDSEGAAGKRGGRSLSRSLDVKRLSTRDSENEDEYLRRRQSAEVVEERRGEEKEEEEEIEDDRRGHRRSQSAGRSATRESDDHRSWEFVARERSSSRGADSKRLSSRSEERELAQRQTRPPLLRSADARRTHSSESEDEHASSRRKFEKRQPSAEPRISDEEDWENELRIRRQQFMEKLATQERDPLPEEGDLIPPRRRSSAEGRIALLKDPSADDNMDSWTVSVGSRVAQLGSSQEPSEPEEDLAYKRRREYREQAPPPREDTQSEEEVIWDASRRRSYTSSSQPTSMEEDDDASYNFVLTKDSKRVSLQDLSKLSQEDSDLTDSGWNIVRKEGTSEGTGRSSSGGLYKRESIVKSQASEEDPEYLLPERPKLVQQEREHPFKKAWQMQKSRSDEEASAYAIKEPREQPRAESRSKGEDSSAEEVKREYSAEQYEDTGAFADDESESITLARSRSTDTEENTRASSRSEETESASMERSDGSEANKASLKSSDVEEDPFRSNWPSEDEQLETRRTGTRSKSEEAEWSWEREET